MKTLITGATGTIGKRLLELLPLSGFGDIRLLTRNKVTARGLTSSPVEIFEWNPNANFIEDGAFAGVQIVLHLAGENVAEGRWSKEKKKRILESRQRGSQLLIDYIRKLPTPPKKFISSSAVGIYGHCGDKEITVKSPLGKDFLAQVCRAWEDCVLNHPIRGMEAHCIRTGVVLSPDGGALKKMLPIFRAGLAGRLGNGRQYMSWIHVDDLVNQFIFLIKNHGQSPVYNGTAPCPVRNLEFTKCLGSIVKRPTFLPVPGLALKIVLGEMSDILLKGQKVLPKQFLAEGFQFKFPKLRDALKNILLS